MILRKDPTRTTLLRRQFHREIIKRFLKVAKEVLKFVDEDDAFGLRQPHRSLFFNAALFQVRNAGEFAFQTDDQKIRSFRTWLTRKVNENVLTTDATGKPWTGKFVESAYKKGQLRAFLDARGRKFQQEKPDFFRGTKEEFLRAAFNQPERLSKVQLLATRAFEELEGITSEMGRKLNRILSEGLIQGLDPATVAKRMSKEIKGLSKGRAATIARTEIVHAHAEGQLDSFQDMDVEEVGVLAEWSTAGDDRVCPRCQENEGETYSIDEARGMIPLHPNCRCAWIPAVVEEKSKRRRK